MKQSSANIDNAHNSGVMPGIRAYLVTEDQLTRQATFESTR